MDHQGQVGLAGDRVSNPEGLGESTLTSEGEEGGEVGPQAEKRPEGGAKEVYLSDV